MIRISGPTYLRAMTIYSGYINLGIFGVALAGVHLWGPRLLLWAFIVAWLWVLFIGAPLALVAWLVGHDRGGYGDNDA